MLRMYCSVQKEAEPSEHHAKEEDVRIAGRVKLEQYDGVVGPILQRPGAVRGIPLRVASGQGGGKEQRKARRQGQQE
eukprot:scaffold44921_cov66-Phaeocystis_antarctica.AAC.3